MNKRMNDDEVVAELESGMTIGIGGWGPRRKPMSLVRALLRSDLDELTIVTYGGADVGLLLAAGKVRKLVYGFVSLDSIPLEPHFQQARQTGTVEFVEYDESMLQWGLYAAALRLPFMPTRSGLGTDVSLMNPDLRTVASPYGNDEVIAVPPLHLDAALVHMNRADERGNAVFLGDDLYFDDLYCLAAERAYLSCERIVPVDELGSVSLPRQRIHRWMVRGVVEAPNGAHFSSCAPDYERDEAFQKHYATSARSTEGWREFEKQFLRGSEAEYQAAVRAFGEDR